MSKEILYFMNENDLFELLKQLKEAKRQRNEPTRSEQLEIARNQLVHSYELTVRKKFYELLGTLSLIKRELDSEYDINETEFYDFRVNILNVDYVNSYWEPNGTKTDYKKVVCGYLTNKETHLALLRKQILERGYFNINDAEIKNFQKPSYIIELKKAEKAIKSLELIKDNKSTELNHLIYKYRESRLDANGDELPFGYDELIYFLKNLAQSKFEETIEKESSRFYMNNQKVIASLKIALDKLE